MIEYFKDDDKVYLVTELCEGGELYDRINEVKRLSEKDAAILFR